MNRKGMIMVLLVCSTMSLSAVFSHSTESNVYIELRTTNNVIKLNEVIDISATLYNSSDRSWTFTTMDFSPAMISRGLYDTNGNRLPCRSKFIDSIRGIPLESEFFTLKPGGYKIVGFRLILISGEVVIRNQLLVGPLLCDLHDYYILGDSRKLTIQCTYKVSQGVLQYVHDKQAFSDLYVQLVRSNPVEVVIDVP